jgi:hypothetical protein
MRAATMARCVGWGLALALLLHAAEQVLQGSPDVTRFLGAGGALVALLVLDAQ